MIKYINDDCISRCYFFWYFWNLYCGEIHHSKNFKASVNKTNFIGMYNYNKFTYINYVKHQTLKFLS